MDFRKGNSTPYLFCVTGVLETPTKQRKIISKPPQNSRNRSKHFVYTKDRVSGVTFPKLRIFNMPYSLVATEFLFIVCSSVLFAGYLRVIRMFFACFFCVIRVLFECYLRFICLLAVCVFVICIFIVCYSRVICVLFSPLVSFPSSSAPRKDGKERTKQKTRN